MKRKIAVITGSRAEFGVITPLIEAIKDSKKLKLQLIVTGMHLLKEHGYTIRDIQRANFKITAGVKIYREGEDTLFDKSKSVGLGIIKFTRLFNEIKPDMVFISGDRSEQLAAVVAAAHLNILIAHYVGGDRTKGGIDESIRHAITKFAHIHLVKTENSKRRIIKLGEDPKNVFVVGFSGLDFIYNADLLPRITIANKLKLKPKKPILVLLQHPVSTQADKAKQQMEETMKAIIKLKQQTVIIYPNSDPGSKSMINLIKKYSNLPYIRVVKSLPYNEYLSLLKISKVLIGNSSGATIEALPFKLPVVNIGIRQADRERTNNTIDVNHDSFEIIKAIKKALHDEEFKNRIKKMKNPFGDGKTGLRIVKILESIKIDKKIIQKQITY